MRPITRHVQSFDRSRRAAEIIIVLRHEAWSWLTFGCRTTKVQFIYRQVSEMETSPFRTNNLIAQTSTNEKQHQSSIRRGARLKDKTCRADGTLTNALHFPMVIDVETTYSIRSKYALRCLLIIGNPGGPKLEPKMERKHTGPEAGQYCQSLVRAPYTSAPFRRPSSGPLSVSSGGPQLTRT